MVSEGRGRLFRRKDGKYLIYVPKDLCEDSMFPFRDLPPSRSGTGVGLEVKVSFKIGGRKELLIEEWKVVAERMPEAS